MSESPKPSGLKRFIWPSRRRGGPIRVVMGKEGDQVASKQSLFERWAPVWIPIVFYAGFWFFSVKDSSAYPQRHAKTHETLKRDGEAKISGIEGRVRTLENNDAAQAEILKRVEKATEDTSKSMAEVLELVRRDYSWDTPRPARRGRPRRGSGEGD